MASRSQQRSLPGLENELSRPRKSSSDENSSASKSLPSDAANACAPRAKPQPAGDDDEPCARMPQAVDIKGWNVYVVDAHSLIFQVFHALPEMSSPHGE